MARRKTQCKRPVIPGRDSTVSVQQGLLRKRGKFRQTGVGRFLNHRADDLPEPLQRIRAELSTGFYDSEDALPKLLASV